MRFMTIAGTVYTILYVRDQERSRAFWQRVLGSEPRLDVPGMTEFALRDGCVLGLMPEEGIARLLPKMPAPASGFGIPRVELYLLVDDPQGIHERALAAGARELSPFEARPWGHYAAYCIDPDGHVLAAARLSTSG